MVLLMATSIRLKSEFERRLTLLAARTGRSKAYYLCEIITNGLEDIEDYYLANETRTHVRKGLESTHLSTEVRKELGLDD